MRFRYRLGATGIRYQKGNGWVGSHDAPQHSEAKTRYQAEHPIPNENRQHSAAPQVSSTALMAPYLMSLFDFLEDFASLHHFGFGDCSALRFGSVQAACVVPLCFGHAVGNLYRRRSGSMDRLIGSIAAGSTGQSQRGAYIL